MRLIPNPNATRLSELPHEDLFDEMIELLERSWSEPSNGHRDHLHQVRTRLDHPESRDGLRTVLCERFNDIASEPHKPQSARVYYIFAYLISGNAETYESGKHQTLFCTLSRKSLLP